MQLTKDRIGAVVIFTVAVAAFVYTGRFPESARMFPAMVSGLMAFLAAAMFLWTFFQERTPEDETPFFRNKINFFITIATTFIYIVLLARIGYFSATFLLMIFLSLVLGYRRYGVLALMTAIFLTFIYVVFIVIFERPLPLEFFQDY